MSTTWLITGTSRGLGYEFVRQLVEDPANTVFATCRTPEKAEKLHALKPKGKLHILQLDQEDKTSVDKAAKEVEKLLEGKGLDYLLNSAAAQYGGNDSAVTLDSQQFMDTIKNCVLGPALVVQALVALVEKGNKKVIMNMTSGLASIGLDCGPKNASYSIAKTALNMYTYKLAKEKPDLITFVIDPGWVKTDMGGPGAMLEPDFSIGNMLKTIKGATQKDSGTFKRYNGEPIPW
ncbi:NADP-binding protein [Dacryopinax primogenitus]|uniref:NADP-binding protein n=1 Tax=Dacryopinax primogenitus (strain DJM 731) TaxID=1858805 RepID=M5G821_DACPD|nr:NADP-binding protein [Dacryopinax primogenitus]EJU04285.1 NADP-binding protein [Dacryopinax primogenitus]